jgi:hypothetical protein
VVKLDVSLAHFIFFYWFILRKEEGRWEGEEDGNGGWRGGIEGEGEGEGKGEGEKERERGEVLFIASSFSSVMDVLVEFGGMFKMIDFSNPKISSLSKNVLKVKVA